MKRVALIAALSAIALPAAAQQGTIGPYGGSIYGGPPSGYSFQYQNNPIVQSPPSYGEQLVEKYTRIPTTGTMYGNQTVCN